MLFRSPSVTFTTTAAVIVTVGPGQTFSPTNVSLSVGGTVGWNWAAGNTLLHNVTFAAVAGAPADIPNMVSGSAARPFGTAGTFTFQCTNHPATMNGQVTVNP